jgi:Kef-type K+ transport system membrane component KefB
VSASPPRQALLRQILHLALPMLGALGLLVWLRSSGLGVDGQGPRSTTIALGFLLIGAFSFGQLAARIGMPRITGYLIAGLVFGPHLSALITKDMLTATKTLDGVAVALIALTAGGEIRLEWVRSQARKLALITGLEMLVVGVLVMGLVLLGRAFFPFMPDDDWTRAVVIAMVFGAVAIPNSPTVTIAVIAETRSAGPLASTTLGVTVLKDVAVIVLFATAMAIARNALGEGGGDSLGWTLTRELLGSVVAGLAVGVGVSWFLANINRDVPVFILAACFGISQVASALHLETLLIALTAGLYVENFAKVDGHRLIDGIERVSMPVYALFFAGAGAKVDLGALVSFAPVALVLILTRAAGVWGGTTLGARLAGAEPVVQRYAWLGFISQAGVTLALSAIVARAFPTWGADIQVIIIAMIAVHELVGPIGFNYALRRAGEIGKADDKGS